MCLLVVVVVFFFKKLNISFKWDDCVKLKIR